MQSAPAMLLAKRVTFNLFIYNRWNDWFTDL